MRCMHACICTVCMHVCIICVTYHVSQALCKSMRTFFVYISAHMRIFGRECIYICHPWNAQSYAHTHSLVCASHAYNRAHVHIVVHAHYRQSHLFPHTYSCLRIHTLTTRHKTTLIHAHIHTRIHTCLILLHTLTQECHREMHMRITQTSKCTQVHIHADTHTSTGEGEGCV
jgi:hypothetical protein